MRYQAWARQPATKSTARGRQALELRDPTTRPALRQRPGDPAGRSLAWLAPVLAARAAGSCGRECRLLPRRSPGRVLGFAVPRRRRPRRAGPALRARRHAGGLASESGAHLHLGQPARLAAAASDSDDPRRDRATQTADGRFTARLPRPHQALRHLGLSRPPPPTSSCAAARVSGSCARFASAAVARPWYGCASRRSSACAASSATSARCSGAPACPPASHVVVARPAPRPSSKVIVTSDRKPAVKRLRVR